MSSTVTADSQITVNGEARPASHLARLSDLVAELGLDARQVAVELNRTIIARSAYEDTPIRGGDAVEIVRFIGGG